MCAVMRAAHAGGEAADGEGQRLVAVEPDAVGAGGDIVVAHARSTRPRCEPSSRQLQRRQHDHHRQREPVDRAVGVELEAEQRQRGDAGDADRAARQALPVQDHQRHDLADRQRRDREIVAAQAERREDEDSAEQGRDQAGRQDGEADRHAKIERQQRRGIAADRQQRGMAQRHQPDRAGDQGEAEAEQRIEPGVDQRLHHIGMREHQRHQRQRSDRDAEQRLAAEY